MKRTIILKDPQNERTYVERRGHWCSYYENGELYASNLSINNAIDIYFQRHREMKAGN